jgi:hypothetical protein
MRIARTAPEDPLSGRHPRSSGSMAQRPDVLGADSVYVSHEREEFLEEIEEERAGRAERTQRDHAHRPKGDGLIPTRSDMTGDFR